MIARGRPVRGYVLLEVLVTIVILVFGLLGLVGFQLRTTVAEHEAYQRVQALVLVQDMVDRIYANRTYAATYVQDDIGALGTLTDCATLTGKDLDVCEWGNALVGASETKGTSSVGTLLGGQGCVSAGRPTNTSSRLLGKGSPRRLRLRRPVVKTTMAMISCVARYRCAFSFLS